MDPNDYPVLTGKDRRRLAFGASDNKDRTRKQQEEPWTNLPGFRILKKATTDDRRRGRRIIPDQAAQSMDNRRLAPGHWEQEAPKTAGTAIALTGQLDSTNRTI